MQIPSFLPCLLASFFELALWLPMLFACGQASVLARLMICIVCAWCQTSMVPSSNLFFVRLCRSIDVLEFFCAVKEEARKDLGIYLSNILQTLDEEVSAAAAAGDLFLMRKVQL